MDLWRVRIAVQDRSGALGAVGAALGRFGIDIRWVDVHLVDGTRVADELLVDLGHRIDPPALERIVAEAGAELLHLCRASEHDLVDMPVRCSLAAAQLAGAGDAAVALLPAAIGQILPFDTVRLARPVDAETSVDRLVVAVPAVGAPAYSLVLTRRRPAFTATELARASAVVRACGETPRAPTLRRLQPDDVGALRRMHDRCSAETHYRRYFSPMPTLSDSVVRRLAGAGIGIAAAYGDEVVGMAHVHPSGRCGELAMVVEDAHQRRGVGTALVRRLVDEARVEGITELAAMTLGDNPAVAPCLRAAGLEPRARWDSGTIRLEAAC